MTGQANRGHPTPRAALTLALVLVLMLATLSQAFQNYSTCGEQTAPLAPETRVIGGKSAQDGEWPWQARIIINGSLNYVCGASLVDPEWVLTAAHCLIGVVNKPELFQFRMGNNRHVEDGPNQQIRSVEKIFMHPDYDIGETSTDPDDDVALLKLTEPFIITDYVRTVCLPTGSMAEDFPGGTAATVTGWGRISPSLHDVSADLQEGLVALVAQEDCRSTYSPIISITDSMLCAEGETGIDFCLGDSGGPLVSKKDGRWFQLGVVSFTAVPCNLAAGVYMRTTAFEDWIAPIFKGNEPIRQDSDCASRGKSSCRYGGCISSSLKCDSAIECFGGSDEEYCDFPVDRYNAFYDVQLNELSISRNESVPTVEDCAQLCLDSTTCVAFDVADLTAADKSCKLAAAGFDLVDSQNDLDVVHFERNPIYFQPTYEPQDFGLDTTARILIAVFVSLGGLILIGVLAWCGFWLHKHKKQTNVNVQSNNGLPSNLSQRPAENGGTPNPAFNTTENI